MEVLRHTFLPRGHTHHEPVIYDPDTNTAHVGPLGANHIEVAEAAGKPDLEHGYTGTILGAYQQQWKPETPLRFEFHGDNPALGENMAQVLGLPLTKWTDFLSKLASPTPEDYAQGRAEPPPVPVPANGKINVQQSGELNPEESWHSDDYPVLWDRNTRTLHVGPFGGWHLDADLPRDVWEHEYYTGRMDPIEGFHWYDGTAFGESENPEKDLISQEMGLPHRSQHFGAADPFPGMKVKYLHGDPGYSEDHEWASNWQPTLYFPDENTVYIGEPGWHHYVIEGKLGREAASANAGAGYIVPHDWDQNKDLSELDFEHPSHYEHMSEHNDPEALQVGHDIAQKLGLPYKSVGWNFTARKSHGTSVRRYPFPPWNPDRQWVKNMHGESRPFVYDPEKDVVHIGDPGTTHMDLEGAYEEHPRGRVYPPGVVEWYNDAPVESDVEAVSNALNAPQAQVGEYHEGVEPSPPHLAPQRWHFGAHRLGWEPGMYGKGLVDEEGNVHTWAIPHFDGYPSHAQYIRNTMGINEGRFVNMPMWESAFHIMPTGSVGLYEPTPALGKKITTADPRLSWESGDGTWKFGGLPPIKRVDIRHPMDEEEGEPHNQTYHEHEIERPVIYDPSGRNFFVGEPLSFHTDLGEALERGGHISEPYYGLPQGRLIGNNEMHWFDWEGDPPHNADEIHQTLGLVPHTGEPWSWKTGHIKMANKLYDFLKNPKNRPDLQTPEAQEWLKHLESLVGSPDYNSEVGGRPFSAKVDQLTPWLTREWKKGRVQPAGYGAITHYYHPHPDEPRRVDPLPDEGLPATISNHATLNHWADFLRSQHPLRRELGDIMQHPIQDFHGRVRDWDRVMKEESKDKAAKGGKVVHQWPDGWTVRQLHTPEELRGEGDAMGHCVGDYPEEVANEHSLIYSLRDPEGKPHVTTEIHPRMFAWTDSFGKEHKGYHQMKDDNGKINHAIPHGGHVEQIQGKGNEKPKTEYQNRMREWFESFSPEERPTADKYQLHGFGDEEDERDRELEMPEDIIPEHDYDPGPGVNDYGLEIPPKQPYWHGLVGNMAAHIGDKWATERHTDTYEDEVYKLAKARGEIPELAKAFEPWREKAWKTADDIREQNLDWLHSNIGEHPSFDEESWDQMTPQEQTDSEKQYDEAQRIAENEMFADWPGIRASHELSSKLHPHYWPDDKQYHNEPYEESLGPQAFSSWRFAKDPMTWMPGEYGRGLYFPDTHELVTWSDETGMTHLDAWQRVEEDTGVEHPVSTHLIINPDGGVIQQSTLNHNYEDEEPDTQGLEAAVKAWSPPGYESHPLHIERDSWSFPNTEPVPEWPEQSDHGWMGTGPERSEPQTSTDYAGAL